MSKIIPVILAICVSSANAANTSATGFATDIWIGVAGQCEPGAMSLYKKNFPAASPDDCNDFCLNSSSKNQKTKSEICFATPHGKGYDLRGQINPIVTVLRDRADIESAIATARTATSLEDLAKKMRTLSANACKAANAELGAAVYQYKKARDSFVDLDAKVTCPAEFKAQDGWISEGVR